MDNSTGHEAAGRDMDDGIGDVDPLLVIANEPFPARHPTESALHDLAPWQHLEARLLARAADDGLIDRGVHKAGASWAPSTNKCFSQGHLLRTAAMIACAPALSTM